MKHGYEMGDALVRKYMSRLMRFTDASFPQWPGCLINEDDLKPIIAKGRKREYLPWPKRKGSMGCITSIDTVIDLFG